VAPPEPDEPRPELRTGTAPASGSPAAATAERRTTDVDAALAAGGMTVEAGEARFDTHPDPPRVSTRKVHYGADSEAESEAKSGGELDPTGPGEGRAETVIAPALPKTTRRDRPARQGAGGTQISKGPSRAFFTGRERRVVAGAAIIGAAVMALSYLVGLAV
jgi:hypothetical protein